ncbi:MAG: hypothetical protein M3P44_07125 [Actinomycetota bacterium]|nr:hypothetical protein [Actinomycetota bacterium]
MIALVAMIAALALPAGALATPVTGAAFTTVNENADGTGHCANGSPNVNCNIYDGKEFVWLNGGPESAYVGNGSYFFAVLVPGGQPDPNDGGAKNLSDDYDAYTDRTFTVSDGTVGYSGGHDFDSNKIRLADYADTTNPGGVYILAICSLADGYPVKPSKCKYDAFKVRTQTNVPVPLTVVKDAAGAYDKTFAWTIAKDVDKTKVEQLGGSATFNYKVTVGHDGGDVSGVKVTGTITVQNFNDDGNGNTVPVSGVNVTDKLSDNTSCTVTGGTGATLTQAKTDFAYSCDLGATLPSGQLDNTVTVTWPEQALDIGTLAADSADFTFSSIAFAKKEIDECVAVTDSYAGTLGTVCVGDPNPTSFEYSRTIAVPANDCLSYDNTATFTTNDTATTGSAGKTVTVCGPAKTGALTMGFWQNKNGQKIISTGASVSGVCKSGTWLRQYAPFQDLSASATCSGVATYVYNVIKAAKAAGSSMNPMLKAQMLATALDVYFSDPALGANKIDAPAPIGGVTIDLTKICKMIDSSTGTATCGGTFQDASSAFGGASALTVSQMLAYAASRSNVGGSVWYGQVKATQELAKNAFDAINNGVAFSA